VVSTDGLKGKEEKTLLKELSFLLAEREERPYSELCGYVPAPLRIIRFPNTTLDNVLRVSSSSKL
jgi:hypothetical protein